MVAPPKNGDFTSVLKPPLCDFRGHMNPAGRQLRNDWTHSQEGRAQVSPSCPWDTLTLFPWDTLEASHRIHSTFWKCYQCGLLRVFVGHLRRLCSWLEAFEDEVEKEQEPDRGAGQLAGAIKMLLVKFSGGAAIFRNEPGWVSCHRAHAVVRQVDAELDSLLSTALSLLESARQQVGSPNRLGHLPEDPHIADTPVNWKHSLIEAIRTHRMRIRLLADEVERTVAPPMDREFHEGLPGPDSGSAVSADIPEKEG